jgi:hypothetical protein
MNTNMEKKQYIVPVVEKVTFDYPLMVALSGSDVPGDVHGAPARHLGGSKSEVF